MSFNLPAGVGCVVGGSVNGATVDKPISAKKSTSDVSYQSSLVHVQATNIEKHALRLVAEPFLGNTTYVL